ncbi:unnamed protein product [Paramecium sonneborni]|uniref:Uncharacterized protein n=1 Tax=Paramecium sonneborni TaxID=65129 RepID=A0A8S1RQA4_9CILI|nr:unnamed protein product [Paramecium sonneborni]
MAEIDKYLIIECWRRRTSINSFQSKRVVQKETNEKQRILLQLRGGTIKRRQVRDKKTRLVVKIQKNKEELEIEEYGEGQTQIDSKKQRKNKL